jgi:hypothetical protein
MTRVGWLADEAGYIGGAELTTAEFRAAAPEGVEIVDCPPGAVVKGLRRYVIQNCVLYTTERPRTGRLDGKPSSSIGTTSARTSSPASATGFDATHSTSAARPSRPSTWASTTRRSSRPRWISHGSSRRRRA